MFRIEADRGMETAHANGADVLVVGSEFEDGQICRSDSCNSNISLLILDIFVPLGLLLLS